MKQDDSVKFVSDDKRVVIVCDQSTPLGVLHDFLMEVRGVVIQKMLDYQKKPEEKEVKVENEETVQSE